MKAITKTIFWLTLFSIAMGYLETAVVVYLRKLYYPDGFDFPLVPVSNDIAVAEFWREAATIIMLVGIGILTGKNKLQRFVFFLYSFAIWDIFYYVFLKALLNWPESLLTWDILFLIPVPWVGPVIAPCIISLSMIVLTFIVVYYQEKGRSFSISFAEWLLLICGSVVVLISFMWDYIMYVNRNGSDSAAWTLSAKSDMFEEVKTYVPESFNWPLYGAGQLLIFIAIFLLYKRLRKQDHEK
jgi:hypothetical protein